MGLKKPVCRSCGETGLITILSLGKTPLANGLLTVEELEKPEPIYPLGLVFCPNCKLVQITETVPPEKLFREYLYFSSFSDTMLRHAQELVGHLILSRQLDGSNMVIEIASNDGYLLQYYKQKGIPVLGIEPAINIAKVAVDERGIPTLSEFFDTELAKKLVKQEKKVDVIHAHNVLAHVSNLNSFVAGIGLLLKENGIAIIEVPYLKDLIDHCEFDTIYHEHLCYFSLISLDSLFQQHGLVIQDVERVAIHGGTLRLFVVKAGSADRSNAVQSLLRDEVNCGMDRFEYYHDFARKVEALKDSLRSLLTNLKQNGKRIAAYGAAAKGSTLLNYFGIGKDFLDYVVDRSTFKQGYYMPGVHLPIYSPEKLLEDMPDYTLLLTWNFADEILAQQAEYRRCGGKFIVPIPEVNII
jgi:SAM-dependent methyltransferase